MALHFSKDEFANRMAVLLAAMANQKLDAVLLFAQESMYWLTGYDTFGFCFFQSLIVKSDGSVVLLTRSADLRQARHTSIIENIVIWTDRDNANPALDLRNLMNDLGLLGARVGVEYDTHGLTAGNGRRLDQQLSTFCAMIDISGMVDGMRLIKSDAEIEKVRRAAELADEALDAALSLAKAGADEGRILAAMHQYSKAAVTTPPMNSSSAPGRTPCSAATRQVGAILMKMTS
jgi:Xaa-Pro dipeptidase